MFLLTLAILFLSVLKIQSTDSQDLLDRYTEGLSTRNGDILNKILDPSFQIFNCNGSVMLSRSELYQSIFHIEEVLLPTIRSNQIIEATAKADGTLFFKVRINGVSINEYTAKKGDDAEYRLISEKHTECQNQPLITSVMDDYLFIAKKTIWRLMSSIEVGTMEHLLDKHFTSFTKCLSETVFRKNYIKYLNAGNSKFILYEFKDIKIYNASRTSEGIIHFNVETKDFTVIYKIEQVEGEYKILSENIVRCVKRAYLSPLVDESKTFPKLANKFAQQYLKALQFKSRRLFKSITWTNYQAMCDIRGLAEHREEFFNKYLMAQESLDSEAEFTGEWEYDWTRESVKFSVDFSSSGGRIIFVAKMREGDIKLVSEQRATCLEKKVLERNETELLDKFQYLVNGYVNATNLQDTKKFFQFAVEPFTIITSDAVEIFKANLEKYYPTEMPELVVKQKKPEVTPMNDLVFEVFGEWTNLSFVAAEANGKWLLTTERRDVDWRKNYEQQDVKFYL